MSEDVVLFALKRSSGLFIFNALLYLGCVPSVYWNYLIVWRREKMPVDYPLFWKRSFSVKLSKRRIFHFARWFEERDFNGGFFSSRARTNFTIRTQRVDNFPNVILGIYIRIPVYVILTWIELSASEGSETASINFAIDKRMNDV